MQMTKQFLELMLDPTLDGRRNAMGGTAIGYASEDSGAQPVTEVASAYAAVVKAPRPVLFEQRWSAWASAFGGGINARGDAAIGSADVTARAYGGAAGLDYRVSPDTVVGFGLGGGATSWGLAQGLGNGRSDAALAGAYGTTHFGPAYFASSISVTNHWMTTDRLAFAGDNLHAKFNAQSYGARVEAGYRLAMPTGGVTPYAAAVAQRFSMPNYRETDVVGGFGLAYQSATATDIRSEIGARFDSPILIGDGAALILRARGAWAHDWVRNPGLLATFQAALLPGALPGAGVGFAVNGAPLPKNSGLASAGAELRHNNWSLLAKFDGEFAAGWSVYSGTGTVRYTW
jgi:outer membrane autotransporter protein